MNATFETLTKCAAVLQARVSSRPKVAIVLGSGLGGLADAMEIGECMPYAELPGFPVSAVPGHSNQFLFGTLNGTPIVAMQGRVHYYEGYDPQEVVLPIRLLGLLGVSTILITAACGGMTDGFQAGDLMLVTDHIATFVSSPLRGPNQDTLGTRFPDMSEVYDAAARKLVLDTARALGIPLQSGVYVQTPGPQFETPAEIRMLHRLGGDAVGMSMAVEAIAARHMGK